MPTTYYISFEGIPSDEDFVDKRFEGALIHCWIVESDPNSAALKAAFSVQQSGWKIVSQEAAPILVTIENFRDRDLGEKAFLEAQENGIAIYIGAYTSVKELHSDVPIRQKRREKFDLHNFIQTQQSVRSQGRCLFYHSTDKCSEVIDAHSIQKSGALSLIARGGYVYSISQKFTDIKKNKGRLSWTRTHINSMSIFRGLCHHHDSLLFRPIDLDVLKPTAEQVFLYAYRCVLKERYAKECSVEIADRLLKDFDGTEVAKQMLQRFRDGNDLGLIGLKNEQTHYDDSHLHSRFDDIRYVMFRSSKAATCVFSGQIYPDWGFNGEPIQDLRDRKAKRSLLTFTFAPTDSGWAFTFAWHKESDAVCRYFISTLQTAIRSGRCLEDLLFSLVVKGCENTAYSPDWVDKRSVEEKHSLEQAMTHGADPLKLVAPDYLASGIADIHGWAFDSVQDNLH